MSDEEFASLPELPHASAMKLVDSYLKKVKDEEVKTKAAAKKRVCHNFLRGKCRFGHRCKFLHDRDAKRAGGGGRPGPAAREPRRAPQSLMAKLVAKSVKKEKSHILQVFRYLVERDFEV